MKALFKNLPIDFYKIIIARLTSLFGTYLNMIALSVFILELTGSSVMVGYFLGLRVLAGLIASLFLGYWADRVERKHLMVISDFVLAAAVLMLLAVPRGAMVYYLGGLMILIGVFSSLFEICLSASIPVLLGEQETLSANSVYSAGSTMVVAAAGLFTAIANYIFNSYALIFAMDGLTYLVSGLLILSIRAKTIQKFPGRGSLETESPKQKRPLLRDMKAAYAQITTLKNYRIILFFLGILLIDAFGSASHNIGWPVFSKEMDPSRPMIYYGIILCGWAVGALIGIYFLNRLRILKNARPEYLYLLFTGIMASGMIGIFQTRIAAVIVGAAIIAGIGDGTYQTYFTTYLQNVRDTVRGKVFALSTVSIRTGFSVGFMLTPLAVAFLEIRWVVFLFHLPTLLVVVTSFIYMRRTVGEREQT